MTKTKFYYMSTSSEVDKAIEAAIDTLSVTYAKDLVKDSITVVAFSVSDNTYHVLFQYLLHVK